LCSPISTRIPRSRPTSGHTSPVGGPPDRSCYGPSTSYRRQRTQRRDGVEDLLGPDADDLAYLRDVEADNLFAPEATILIFNEALVPIHRTPRAAFTETIQAHPILAKTLERGAKLVWMPRLEPAQDIDTRRLTFAEAEASAVKEGQAPIGPWKRQQIATWRRAMETAFAPVAAWLP
jgi:hypothetical protein